MDNDDIDSDRGFIDFLKTIIVFVVVCLVIVSICGLFSDLGGCETKYPNIPIEEQMEGEAIEPWFPPYE